MPFLSVVPHYEPVVSVADEQKAVFSKLRGLRFTTERGGLPKLILDSNLRNIRSNVLSSNEKVQANKNKIKEEIEQHIKSAKSKGSANTIYVDFTLFGYDASKENVHRLYTYKPGDKLKIGIHSKNDLESEEITDKYDYLEEFKSIETLNEVKDLKVTFYDLSDDMYNSILELNRSFIEGQNEAIKYGKLAALTTAAHALSTEPEMSELNGKSIIFKSEREYIGDDSEDVLLFDFLGHQNGINEDTGDIINKDLDTAAKILHNCIWLINISERGRPDGSSQYDLHTRINITLAFSKCKNAGRTFYVNGVPFNYTVHNDFSEIIQKIDVDSEGVLQDPDFPTGIGADNSGNHLILNRYLGTIARYKDFKKEKPNEWFETYLRLITNMNDIDFYEFASEVLRNIMIICSQEELGITLFKMARTRFCAHQYCHTEIDPTFPVNLNIPRIIPIEPLEVETNCGCNNK